MKKYLTAFLLLVIILSCALYFFMPTAQNFSCQTFVNCAASGASRQIIYKAKWKLWWPGQKKNDTVYSYKNWNYRIDKILLNSVKATIFSDKDSVKGNFQFTYDGIDSTEFKWTATGIFSANPRKRLMQYIQFNKIKNNVENLLADTKKYFDHPENIYGMRIEEQKVTESSMISVKKSFSHYPSTQEIYTMVHLLTDYIAKKSGEEKGYPMLHIEQESPVSYETMVAVPTKNDLPSEGKFQLKKFVPGSILMAEVKGGSYTVIAGEKELANYVIDFRRNSPAIPFQSLVTNRLLEADTSKWITRLFYPVF